MGDQPSGVVQSSLAAKPGLATSAGKYWYLHIFQL